MTEIRLATIAVFTDGQVPLEFVFEPVRPMQVALEFSPGDDPVRWVVARSLIASGLWDAPAGAAGRGDVRLWHCPIKDQSHVHLWLCERAGGWSAEFTVARAPLALWLHGTYKAVEHAAEHCGLGGGAMDAELARMLGATS